MSKQYDLAVVGGGMVGAALAAALATRFNIALIEAVLPQPPTKSHLDMRVSALNLSSVRLLKRLGVWDSLWRTCPFRHVEVWEQGVSPLRFSAHDIAAEHLGFIVENSLIQIALLEKIKSTVTLFNQKVLSVDASSSPPCLHLADGQKIEAQLIIGADGQNSIVRKEAGIGSIHREHSQQALVIQVRTDSPQQDTTWQRFTPTGAQALLPLPSSAASLVWYNSPAYTQQLSSFTDKQFLAHLRQAYPERLGNIAVENRISFPICCHHAEKYVHENILLIGDAAHSFHPLAGQGVNFGLKDVEVLTKQLHNLSPDELRAYQKKRLLHNLMFMLALEMMDHGFSHLSLPYQLLRKTALRIGRFPPLKKALIAEAEGENILSFLLK